MKVSTKPPVVKIRLKKGDLAVVRSGRFKGQTGRITAVHPRLNKVTIENLNMVKKHHKPSPRHPQGGILEVSKPIGVSKVALVEPGSGKPSKIGYQIKQGGKTRIYKKTGRPVALAVSSKSSGGKK